MYFAGLSYLAVALAGVAGFAFGATYYMTFGNRWMNALGKTKKDIEDNKSPLPFIIAAIAQFVMAFVLAGAIGHLGDGMVTVPNAIITALFLWVGFVLTTMAVNYASRGRNPC